MWKIGHRSRTKSQEYFRWKNDNNNKILKQNDSLRFWPCRFMGVVGVVWKTIDRNPWLTYSERIRYRHISDISDNIITYCLYTYSCVSHSVWIRLNFLLSIFPLLSMVYRNPLWHSRQRPPPTPSSVLAIHHQARPRHATGASARHRNAFHRVVSAADCNLRTHVELRSGQLDAASDRPCTGGNCGTKTIEKEITTCNPEACEKKRKKSQLFRVKNTSI